MFSSNNVGKKRVNFRLLKCLFVFLVTQWTLSECLRKEYCIIWPMPLRCPGFISRRFVHGRRMYHRAGYPGALWTRLFLCILRMHLTHLYKHSNITWYVRRERMVYWSGWCHRNILVLLPREESCCCCCWADVSDVPFALAAYRPGRQPSTTGQLPSPPLKALS